MGGWWGCRGSEAGAGPFHPGLCVDLKPCQVAEGHLSLFAGSLVGARLLRVEVAGVAGGVLEGLSGLVQCPPEGVILISQGLCPRAVDVDCWERVDGGWGGLAHGWGGVG